MNESLFPIIFFEHGILINLLLTKPNGLPMRVNLKKMVTKEGILLPLCYRSITGMDWLQRGKDYLTDELLLIFMVFGVDGNIREYVRSQEQNPKENLHAIRRITIDQVFVRGTGKEAEMLGMMAFLLAEGDVEKMKEMLSSIDRTTHCDYQYFSYEDLEKLILEYEIETA